MRHDAGPLRGVLILSAGSHPAQELAAQTLADDGATVVRLDWSAPEIANGGMPPAGPPAPLGAGPWSCAINRATANGLALLRSLVERADGLILGGGNQGLDDIASDGAGMLATYPRLVLISIDDPGSARPDRDPRGQRAALPAAAVDTVGGVLVATLLAGALHHREATGLGEWVRFSPPDLLLDLAGEDLLDRQMNQRATSARGDGEPPLAALDLLPCRGDDAWIAIAIESNEQWAAFAQLMGTPPWADRFDSAFMRAEHATELFAHLAEWTRGRDAEILAVELQSFGIAAAPALPIAAPAIPIRPPAGLHTRHVLAALLGLGDVRMEELEAEGAIWSTPEVQR